MINERLSRAERQHNVRDIDERMLGYATLGCVLALALLLALAIVGVWMRAPV